MSESVWIALVQFLLSPTILLILGVILNRKIKETKQEITNSHPLHLRDDLDGKFHLVFARQDTMQSMLKTIDEKVDSHRDDIGQLYSTMADHERRLNGQATKLRKVSTK